MMWWALSLSIITLVSGITLPLNEGQELCFGVMGGKEYRIEYVISGVEETNVAFKIVRGLEVIERKDSASEFSKNVNLPEGEIKLCFESTDDKFKMLSVDFFPATNQLKNMVTNKDISLLSTELTKLYNGLEERYRNQEFQSERDQVHRNVLEQTEGKIKWLGIFKIVMLLLSALVQLWIMKGFLKERIPYQPV